MQDVLEARGGLIIESGSSCNLMPGETILIEDSLDKIAPIGFF